MHNKHTFQAGFLTFMMLSAFMFFGHTETSYAAESTGTLQVCSVVASSTELLPEGQFSLSFATTTDLNTPVFTYSFNANTFETNTVSDGISMYCTDAVSVPFGNYYYNNVSIETASSQWLPTTYVDTPTTAISTITPSVYTNGLFTESTEDDILINTASDGLVVVSAEYPHRTVFVFNKPTDVFYNTSAQSSVLAAAEPTCSANVNLISNGGFESPVVHNPALWTSIPLGTPDFFWTSLDTVVYPYIEVQAGYTEGTAVWTPHSGIQYAEIDGGTNHDVSQVLATIPGNTYSLSYWMSPRPSLSSDTNRMNVFANGSLIDTVIESGTTTTAWSQRTLTFVATSTQTRISFTQGQNVHTGEGVFIDDVSVVCAGVKTDTSIKNQCVLPDTFGDIASEHIGVSYGSTEKVVQTMLTEQGYALNALLDQKEYQSWALPFGTTTIEVQYLDGQKGGSEIFGYYLNNDISTFVPVFASGPYSDVAYPNLPEATNGEKFTITVNGSSIQFALFGVHGGDHYTSTVRAENEFGADRVLVYEVPQSQTGGEYILAFEDLKISASDNDYNDDIVKISFSGCDTTVKNTPPTITLTGATPTIVTVGQTFTDQGATATDLEDGNITHKVVVTGTVGTLPGTYTLTYTVTDLGGLSASTTRTVIVLPVAVCSANVNLISNGGFESPVVHNPALWTSIPLGTPDFFWTSLDTVVYPYIEVQAGYTEGTAVWTPHSGIQYAEIDGGTNHDVSQVLATIPGNTYSLSYWMSPRPSLSSDTNRMNVFANGSLIDTVIESGTTTTAWSQRTLTFVATSTQTRISFTQGQNVHTGEGVFIDDVSVVCNPAIVKNTPPTITLVGANPANLTVGQSWVEPGATANDLEDGNITNNIVITGTVNVNVVGTYPLVYTVTDSGGLSASTTRQVIVSPAGGGGVTTGKITFCSIFANKDTNAIATTSLGLPTGSFTLTLGTTTDIGTSAIQTKTWTASAFAPNTKIMLSQNDADCVSYDNLPLGTYYYSELGVTGTAWIISSTSPLYNDQFNTPVNNIFDVFAYSPELFTATTTDDTSRNVNADGQIVLSADRREHTVVIATKYNPVTPPVEPPCLGCGGGTITPPACTSNCGGGGNGPIVSSLAITNEKVVEITPGVALVTWNTNLPATKEVGYGTTSQPASFIVAPFGYATSTVRVSEPLTTVHSYTIPIESGKTYYFRPVSTDNKTTVAGIELVLNPGTGIGGGNETGNSCYYLFDYLKQGWNNNPVEVKKLQVFLRDLEGFSVEVTGVYDDQTVSALNAFQNRYKDDILTPWGHTAPTSFTYITTKKKVNEIYCKMAFPVTAQQQTEIDAYRAFLQGLSDAGVTIGAPTEEQNNQPVIIDTNEVGTLFPDGVSTTSLGTLAGAPSQSTTTTAGRLTANVLEASKRLGNVAAAIVTWPFDWVRSLFGTDTDMQCEHQSVFSQWFNWILIIVIITMSYLWYRERQANKKALEINEELDLMRD